MRSLRTVSELTEELRVLPTGMRIIAIDGRCAAGKTTLAARLAKELGGDVIHMDDFFLPPALFDGSHAEACIGTSIFLSEI